MSDFALLLYRIHYPIMADTTNNEAAAQAAPATDAPIAEAAAATEEPAAPKLVLDEVTGEMVSKK